MTDPEPQRESIGSDSERAMRDYDPSSHGRVQVMADATVYEPGPSFVENEHPAGRLTEMPAWLQTFAASESDQNAVLDTAVESVPAASGRIVPQTPEVAPDDPLPDWLRTRPSRAEMETSATVPADFDDFQLPADEGADSFISEDDLPDWLRAFSRETTGGSPSNVQIAARAASTGAVLTGTTAVRVPPVENVWLSAYDRQALGPGRTLFALLASNGGIATDVGAHGTHADHGRVGDSATETGHVHPQAVVDETGSGPVPVASRAVADKPGSPMRLVMLALLVVVVLIIVGVIVV